ncbi:thioester domain-containing protein [Actinocatenispora rupis]|uniref:thioester domain-containing protein n=1 Tax=Actinocatenispora rupis TaxID=519421 RepID=UPI001941B06E|nr:thioester domain-containing protein [Actinocatenispora rupis]
MVVAATGALVLGGASSAFAKSDSDKAVSPKAASELPSGGAVIGREDRIAFVEDNQPTKAAPIAEFTLKFSDGSVKKAYCIDFHHDADSSGTEYDPGQWNESTVKNLPKIQWILTNSFPHESATELLNQAGVSDTAGIDTEFVAYSATQTAIWHFSDGVEITGNSSRSGGRVKPFSDKEYAALTKVREYLVGKAGTTPEPPAPSLSIDPQQASGHAGDKIGPFTVQGTGTVDHVKLTVNGDAEAVDADGNAVSSPAVGSKFWLVGKSASSVTVSADGVGVLPTGSVYLAKAGPHKFQQLILADTATKNVGAQATVTVTTKPSPSPTPSSASPSAPAASPSASGTAGGGLPVTGTSLPIIVGVALVLLAGGGAAVVFARRRRVTQ